jgi:hypothetical protein
MNIKEKLSNKFPFFPNNFSNKKYYLKKFNQFVLSIITIKNNVINKIECKYSFDEKLNLIFKTFLKRSPSSYLRLDCIQELFEKYKIN